MGLKRGHPQSSSAGAIEVHIEQIVLHGYAPGDTHRLGEALQAELTRLVQKHGVNSSGMGNLSLQTLDGGRLKAAERPSTEALGARLAQRIHQVIVPAAATPAQGNGKPRGARP